MARDWFAHRMPMLVSAALAAVILGEGCGIIQRWRPPDLASITPRRAAPGRSARTHGAVDVQGVIDAQLFGVAPPAADAVSQETREPLLLHGTMAMTEPEQGLAIVAAADGSSVVYRVGDELPGGLQLHQVFPDHITLSRGTLLESLYLPKSTPPATLAPEAASNAAPSPDVAGGADVMRTLILRPAPRGSRGMRVYGTQTAALAALGFAPGDIIHEINGVSMDEPSPERNALNINRQLSEGERLSMIVERQGARTAVTLDPARLSPSRTANAL